MTLHSNPVDSTHSEKILNHRVTRSNTEEEVGVLFVLFRLLRVTPCNSVVISSLVEAKPRRDFWVSLATIAYRR